MMHIIFISLLIFCTFSVSKESISKSSEEISASVGYRVGQVDSVKKIRSSQKSTLYELSSL